MRDFSVCILLVIMSVAVGVAIGFNTKNSKPQIIEKEVVKYIDAECVLRSMEYSDEA